MGWLMAFSFHIANPSCYVRIIIALSLWFHWFSGVLRCWGISSLFWDELRQLSDFLSEKLPCDLMATLMLIWSRIWLAFFTARSCCLLTFTLLSTRICRYFPAELLPGLLFHPRGRILHLPLLRYGSRGSCQPVSPAWCSASQQQLCLPAQTAPPVWHPPQGSWECTLW